MGTEKRGRGFTIIELGAVVIVVAILVVFLLPLMAPRHHGSRQIKDSMQVRGIHQGMVLWAQNNKDVYPLPSLLDSNNDTVAAEGEAKDTTANIMSVMIYNGFFSPELCVSPAEANGNIKVMDGYGGSPAYSYSNPKAAVNPGKALWDPAFSTDFTGGKTGYFSYGHMLPAGTRREKDWTNNFDAARAAIGNRGPEMAGVGTKEDPHAKLRVVNPNTNTFLIHGGRTTWEGNIAYNDNHINFETRLDPESTPYKDAKGKAWFDCLFFDEADDPSGRNNFLGNFVKAGSSVEEFKSIWD
jgi:type II secretory pathway pseudopilin PulG